MKLKLDENLNAREADLFRQAGHDVATVAGESLCSATDRALLEACRRESRGLVTLDLDFAQVLVFRPSDYAGIAVLRLPPRPGPADLDALIRTLAEGLARSGIARKLWIVEPGRIREYQSEESDS